MSCSKSKEKKNSERLIELVKGRTQLAPQPTLELYGFGITSNNNRDTASVSPTSGSQVLCDEIPLCHPFVKWAGGKGQILTQLYALAPSKFDRYFEPFLGGGALFFYLISNINKRFAAYLSDINPELINSYIVVKDNDEKLIILLTQYEIEYNKAPEEYYYKLRRNDRSSDKIERAAQFIALNKTCFNGLYRVNQKGDFNVPRGKYKNPRICDSNNLRNLSVALRQHLYLSTYQADKAHCIGLISCRYTPCSNCSTCSWANFASRWINSLNTLTRRSHRSC